MSGASGEAASGLGSGELGSGELGSGSGDLGSFEPLSPPDVPPPSPSPPPLHRTHLIAAADAAPPAYTIASAPAGSARLLVDAASPLAALQAHAPFMVRIGVGRPQQEDVIVTGLSALHGTHTAEGGVTAADGRFALLLAAPTKFAHVPGEALRHIARQAVLSTRFTVHAGSRAHLFDARILGPDAPTLDADGEPPLSLQLVNITNLGMTTLEHAVHGQAALAAATAAIRGWACFGFEPAVVAASSVAIRLFGVRKSAPLTARGPPLLSRGGPSAQDAAPPTVADLGASAPSPRLRHLAAVLDPATSVGYWSNVSEAGSGWVAKLRLDELPRPPVVDSTAGAFSYSSATATSSEATGLPTSAGGRGASWASYWQGAERLTSAERRAFGLGLVAARYGSEQYARYTTTSELGLQRSTMLRMGVDALAATGAAPLEEPLASRGVSEEDESAPAGERPWPVSDDEAGAGLAAAEADAEEEEYVRVEYDMLEDVWDASWLT